MVRLLVARAASVAGRAGPSGRTPLHCAAGRGHVEVCAALVAAGATVSEVDASGRTPLQDAEAVGRASDALRATLGVHVA